MRTCSGADPSLGGEYLQVTTRMTVIGRSTNAICNQQMAHRKRLRYARLLLSAEEGVTIKIYTT
jgi:hypothetical protein